MNKLKISRIIELCGGAQFVASKLKIKTGSVYMWSYKNSIPHARITQLKELFPHVITDDVFDALTQEKEA